LKRPVEKSSAAIPGYKGFVPGVKSSSLYGKSFTEQTRDVLKPDLLDMPGTIASTGYNFKKEIKQDFSMHAVSNKYGGQTIMATSPNSREKNVFQSSTKTAFQSPNKSPRPNWRSRGQMQNFDNQSKVLKFEKKRNSLSPVSPKNTTSGFAMNSTLFDGTSWGPEKNLNGDMVRTIYRNQFNQPKPFHKGEVRVTMGTLRRKSAVYDKE